MSKKLDSETTDLIAVAIGSLIVGLLITAGLKYAFSFTWFQALMLSWLYCILRDACLNSKN
jgi:hypothetical protein